MRSLLQWASAALSDGENPSALRLVMVPGVLLTVATACGTYVWCTYQGKPMPTVPLETSAFLLSLLSTLLGAKVMQSHIEGKTPPPGPEKTP